MNKTFHLQIYPSDGSFFTIIQNGEKKDFICTDSIEKLSGKPIPRNNRNFNLQLHVKSKNPKKKGWKKINIYGYENLFRDSIAFNYLQYSINNRRYASYLLFKTMERMIVNHLNQIQSKTCSLYVKFE